MQRKYRALEGQSLYDVCLNTYGTLNLLSRLMVENGVERTDLVIKTGDEFTWDDDFVFDVLVLRKKETYFTGFNEDFIQDGTVVFADESSTDSRQVIFITEDSNPSYFREQ